MDYVFSSKGGKRYVFPTHTNDLIIDRSESIASEAFMVIVKPGNAVHHHAHPDIEQVFYIIEGTGDLFIGPRKRRYSLKPTQVVRIPPGTLHSVRPSGQEPVRYLCVDIFTEKTPREPTWDAHVRAVCRTLEYSYKEVAGSPRTGRKIR